ncbi:sarcosine oxidase subunit gamma [Fuscibacter oryzae]|uniref:Sarcosine oxidase subunit gamma n=1 Tax=Fuscibacter oryzae TaxID=2803939 RepID=A0A8J7SRE4_9RHOB|nr:sarcosine oxidase subunit gamma [Fuscibacter oryzae]MBL4926870.1 sarcosine oxidase subunit gamma [Fuscibacter oryzae]
MTDLSPISALGHAVPQAVRIGTLTITENAGLALASLALRQGGGAPQPFGLPLPGPGGWANAGATSAFWTGPGAWMIEADGRAEDDFASALKAEAPGCSVAEQTDGWAVFEIAASVATLEALLEKLVNIDASRFVPGSALRTGLEHMSVFLIRRTEGQLALWAMRSAAGSAFHAIEAAARRLDVA